MLILFWSAAGVLLYIFAAFPALMLVRAKLRPRPFRSGDIAPTATIVIAAHNEAAAIGDRLENLLGLDYPRDRLQILVASDGSTDATEQIVRQYEAQGVRLLALPRGGKIAALNRALEEAEGEIVVFSDANTCFARDALRALARPFADPQVGGVAGDQVYLKGGAMSPSAAGERMYWNLDRALKRAQSCSGSVTSATGAIYAVRRSLLPTIPAAVTDDFYVSTGVIARGYRLVFAQDAIAYEPVAASARGEFQRKVRVMTRGLRGVVVRRELLNPFRFGFYSLQLFSHKVLRRLAVFPLAALWGTSLILANDGVGFLLLAAAQTSFYGCAGIGFGLGRSRLGRLRIFAAPAYFCLVYAAAAMAAWNTLYGRRIDRWNTDRPHTAGAAA
ncbi:MAG: glycosyltransferase family 2 protein [Planctomycetes bacterium]|nr:glycosyltransferase family 2 protein [Planctomycetota bacterium]